MIQIKSINKTYQNQSILNQLSIDIQDHHTISILGKSGCGKSTFLKVLSGLETPDSGKFEANGQDLFKLPPKERGVVYMSQEPLLFPHLNVHENIAFGLKIRRVSNSEVTKKVKSLAEKLGLTEQLMKMPDQLSGGQKQRVSFGRALIVNPKIMLLDEPFGSLDTQTRTIMQKLFKDVSTELKMTAVFVTHDLKEALLMGDKVALMKSGQIKIYENNREIIDDHESGATEEINFWKQFS